MSKTTTKISAERVAQVHERAAQIVSERNKFGAPVTSRQIVEMATAGDQYVQRVKRSRKLKSELKRFASDEIRRGELERDTLSMLQLASECYDVKTKKGWPTKSAVILLALTSAKS